MIDLITIIVPVYKVEEYLDRCVNSLVNQTYKNLEIILVDDGSPDNCPHICDLWAAKDNRIRVIHRENGGLSAARNDGIRSAHGKYILFIDSDDYIELDACERLLQYADDADVIVAEATIIENGKPWDRVHSNLKENYVYTGPEYARTTIKKNEMFVAACYNMYRLEFLKNNNLLFLEGVLHEDNDFTPRVFLAAEKVKYIHFKFYNYVIRDDSITGRVHRKQFDDLIKIYSRQYELTKMIADRKTQKSYAGALAKNYIYTCRTHKVVEPIYPTGMNSLYLIKNSLNFIEFIKAIVFTISRKFYYKL